MLEHLLEARCLQEGLHKFGVSTRNVGGTGRVVDDSIPNTPFVETGTDSIVEELSGYFSAPLDCCSLLGSAFLRADAHPVIQNDVHQYR